MILDTEKTGNMGTVRNAFTVDVEDYFQVSAFDDLLTRAEWDSQELRVEANTRRLLDLLDEFGVKGTFFILGWVADRVPGIVREIAERGHELGAHSFEHQLVYRMARAEFEEDLDRTVAAVRSAAGVEPTVFRAPSFSITKSSMWALEVLAERGFTIDSSIFPVHHDRYGIADFERYPLRHNGIVEFPMTTWRVAGINVPCSGGGYLRIFPEWILHRGILQANRLGQPAVLYLHPWEVDPEQPRLAAPWKTRIRHYTGLGRVMGRLRRLLERFEWGTLSQSVETLL